MKKIEIQGCYACQFGDYKRSFCWLYMKNLNTEEPEQLYCQGKKTVYIADKGESFSPTMQCDGCIYNLDETIHVQCQDCGRAYSDRFKGA